MTEDTGQKQNGALFQPGQSGNPAGRPKGARSKLGEKFLEDMLAAWEGHGIAAINKVIAERPQDFLKVIASILPKEIAAEFTHRFVARMPQAVDNADQWQEQYTPKMMQ